MSGGFGLFHAKTPGVLSVGVLAMHPGTLPSITPPLQYSITPIFYLSMTNRAAREAFDLVFLH